MKITKVNIQKSSITNGLETVNMDRLGQVVLLAGKNGSGKTRLLNLILEKFNLKLTDSDILEKNKIITNRKSQILNLQNMIDERNQKINLNEFSEQKTQLRNQIEIQTNELKRDEKNLEQLQNSITWGIIETDNDSEFKKNGKIVNFVPKTLNLDDWKNFRHVDLEQYSKRLDNIGIDNLQQGTFSRIKTTQNKWFEATHQSSTISDDEKQDAIDDYNNLKEIIKTFLDTNLDRNKNGEPTLFGLPLGESNLSDGQKILIQLCLAIHCQQSSLNELILFLDEPENHLHPSVIIEIVEKIKSKTTNGQIWIATHSVPLLSYFDPSTIWFVDNNKVSYAGAIPEKVLNSLLGDEEQIYKLQDFINLPAIYALNRHAFECLFQPQSIITSKDDPQTLQINEEIKKHLVYKNKIRILDYGAGKGRLLLNIVENFDKSDIKTKLDYVVFDKFDKDKVECEQVIAKVYSDKPRYFNDFSELNSHFDHNTFDIVIMCNVLHEIDPSEWLKLFSEQGEIPKLLKDTGILLIVEDQEMQIGEKAYNDGFIVLNTADLKKLFIITENDKDFGFDVKKEGRLKSHSIKKEYIMRITAESRVKCLEQLHATAKSKINTIRSSKNIDYKAGKKHGFWIQQYANTGLALDKLTNK